MKRKHFFFYHVVIFIIAQIAWLSLIGLWIYWYVYNYIVYKEVGDRVSPEVSYDITNVGPFVIGLVLLVGLSLITIWIFRHLNVQLRLTKLYDTFISNVTHELKSPLSSIQLSLETLKTRDVPQEKQKEFVGMMIKDVNRLTRLINSILQIPALEQKKFAYSYKVYSAGSAIKQILNESIEQFRLPADAINIKENAVCEFVIDIDGLKTVFDNLIDNAVKYSLQPAKINVNIRCNTQKVVIEFTDNGIGIAPKELKKVFNKFHRVYHQNIPNVKGTGLGLYQVKEIINNHGGNIYIFSEGDGKGTTFNIELPIYKVFKKRFLTKLLKQSEQKKQLEIINE
ncbi:MAG: HAMP domain-containing sensor histidine kinase [Ignavibacteriaceae bacterium]